MPGYYYSATGKNKNTNTMMMKIHTNRIFTLTIALLIMLSSEAQKYGHLNLGNLLIAMPATKTAEASLDAYQKSLVEKGEKMTSDYNKRNEALLRKYEGGVLTPLEQQQGLIASQKEQEKILAYETEITELVAKKRQELLKPIIQVAEEAIKKVARENGYVMVFDTSVFNAVLFATYAEDLMPMVKEKLGISQ